MPEGQHPTWIAALALALCLGCASEPEDGFDLVADVSEVVSTVVSIEWTAEGDGSATVEVGEDEGYGRTFAATLEDGRYAATLLGLRPATGYHYRVVEELTDGSRTSEDRTFATGSPPLGLAWTETAGTPQDGYAVTSLVHVPSIVAILDGDGEYVWWLEVDYGLLPGNNAMVTRNALSRDGRSMLFLAWTPQFPGLDCTTDRDLVRISLDGRDMDNVLVEGAHHDFVELPDGTVALLAYERLNFQSQMIIGDRIVEVDPDGTQRTVWSVWDHVEPDPDVDYDDGTDYTHANALRYDEADDAYYVSLRLLHSIFKIDRATSEVIWRLGGEDSDFTLPGGGTDLFSHQHHFQILDDGLILFDNGEEGAGESRVVQYRLDETTWTATEVWSYDPDPARAVYSLGDVSRFDDDRTLVTWATAGELELLGADGEREWMMSLGIGTGFGYTTWVERLPGEI